MCVQRTIRRMRSSIQPDESSGALKSRAINLESDYSLSGISHRRNAHGAGPQQPVGFHVGHNCLVLAGRLHGRVRHYLRSAPGGLVCGRPV